MNRQPRPSNLTVHGLTLVELLCGMAIAVTAVGTAVPSLKGLQQTQQLHAVAARLETDVQLARSLARTRGEGVRLSVQALDAGGSCTMVHTGGANDCRCNAEGQAECVGEAEVLSAAAQPARGAWITTTGRSLVFDGSRGTVTPTATLKIASADGSAIHQIVNIMGRTRSCTPQGRVAGIKPC
jgi:type IV fimbrial biogenesis protein FimT